MVASLSYFIATLYSDAAGSTYRLEHFHEEDTIELSGSTTTMEKKHISPLDVFENATHLLLIYTAVWRFINR